VPQIIAYSRDASEEEIAAMRKDIEASGMRVLGEPDIELVPNDGYIIVPDEPDPSITWRKTITEVYRVTFQVEAARGTTGP